MPPFPNLVFATPSIDLATHNEAVAFVVDMARWDALRMIRCSIVFRRESAYNESGDSVDHAATDVLLANNSLHYGRTVDIESFFVAYDPSGTSPLGVGFGSFGAPQSWTMGMGPKIVIPKWVPVVGGRTLATFQDDMPLTPGLDARVTPMAGMNMLPWDALECVDHASGARRLYVSTPNHLLDFVNRNPRRPHVEQRPGVGEFRAPIHVPSPEHGDVEAFARSTYPDASDPDLRSAVRLAAETVFGRPWLF